MASLSILGPFESKEENDLLWIGSLFINNDFQTFGIILSVLGNILYHIIYM